jgi:protein SCO1/2
MLLLWVVSACAPARTSISTISTSVTEQITAPPTAQTSAASAADLYIGDLVQPPVQLRDFTLPSHTGDLMSLSDLDGQWRVIFFGYLHCPDFCPLTLAEYRRVKMLLGDDAERVEFVYISVDGARDTPQALREYLDNFDPEFIGLSGDDETLARIQPDYGFYYQRRLDSGSQAVYIIDHSTRSYLVDPSGQLRATFTYDVNPDAIAEAIRWHMQQGQNA